MLRRTHNFLLLLLLVLPTSGCLFRSHKVAVRTQATGVKTANLNELVGFINTQAEKLKTLNATVDIDTSVGGAKKGKVTEYQEIRGYILARKPSMLRMVGLFPVVRNRAFDMVSDGNNFKLSIPAKNQFIVGPSELRTPSANSLENLRPNIIYDALLMDSIRPGKELAVLEQSSEIIRDDKNKREIEHPEYVVNVIETVGKMPVLARKVIFSRADLLPQRQLIYDKDGNVVTEARYTDYKDYDGLMFPNQIEISRPREEYNIGLKVVKLAVNEPLKDDQFALDQPAGSELRRVGSEGNQATAAQPGGSNETQNR